MNNIAAAIAVLSLMDLRSFEESSGPTHSKSRIWAHTPPCGHRELKRHKNKLRRRAIKRTRHAQS